MAEDHGLTVTVAETADAELHAVVAQSGPATLHLVAAPPTLEHLRRIVEDPATTLLLAHRTAIVADAPGQVVGMLTLAVFMLPTGVRAWIEDVVVDDSLAGRRRGQRAGRGGARARRAERGARTVDLTSRPRP